MKRLTETGSHVVALALGVLVIGVIIFAGYTVMQRQDGSVSTADSSTAKTDTASSSELKADEAELDASSKQLDSGLDDSSLDADLNDML